MVQKEHAEMLILYFNFIILMHRYTLVINSDIYKCAIAAANEIVSEPFPRGISE